MYRKIILELKKWKEKKDRLPLILKGARQVGKTWILQEFGKEYFEDVLYINFENAGNISNLFDGNIEPNRIIEYLSALNHKKIEPEKTLIIFDEIQELPRALTSLKYFAEQTPEYAICCAGSLLGVFLHDQVSFPVGKVDFLELKPLDFEEFLIANNENELINIIKKNGLEKLPDLITDKLKDYLKKYFVIGGMPRAVKAWIEEKDFELVEEIQKGILEAYERDFSKHTDNNTATKIQYVWNSIPSQLAKENRKFIYGVVKNGARAREYENSINWLRDTGLIRIVNRVKCGDKQPLKAYEDLKAFKIYLLDVGLLRVLCELPYETIINADAIYNEFNGLLTEQFVLQELKNINKINTIYYWSNEFQSEVDFIFAYKNLIIPVEAKAGVNVKAQSLKVYMKENKPKFAIRYSLLNITLDNNILNIPLYAIWNTENYLKEIN
ncbi:MAG: ATP-binding protein [Clostridia bacterium]|nr:ATP-binding protein [Clostridia bacterium]